jgi:transcriptional regulator with PAS, ATPase and Fis domain
MMNIINSAVIIESSNEIRKKSLPNYVLESTAHLVDAGPSDFALKTMEEVEKDHIKKILGYTGGNKTKASQILGISRVNLLSKVKKYRLES